MGLVSFPEYGFDPGGNRWPRGVQPALAGTVQLKSTGHPKTLRRQTTTLPVSSEKLQLLSIVIPARNEEGAIPSTLSHLHLELSLREIPHEVIVVDDGSTDRTWEVLSKAAAEIPEVRPVMNRGLNGFGRAIQLGLSQMRGDAVVIMMADESDDCRDVVRYWNTLNEGYDCVFGSRFLRGGGVIDYPWVKLVLNRAFNFFIRVLFRVKLNDTTNAFKAYRRSVIQGISPILSQHFNLTVELPLKAIVRGYSWKVIPITWKNRRFGVAKLKISEMGSRYLFICLYVWLEKMLSRGDYRKRADNEPLPATASGDTPPAHKPADGQAP
jgi:dolichol-phosphate mannosyltransferase